MEYLEYRKLNKYNYQIVKDVKIPIFNDRLKKHLFKIGTIEHPYYTLNYNYVLAKALYAWDGATGIPDTPKLMIPSLIHDIGCQSVNNEIINFSFRKEFDKEYYYQVLAYGLNKEIALVQYLAIRGWGMIPKDKDKEEFSKVNTILIIEPKSL